MTKNYELQTKRLLMRQWRTTDYVEFAKLNADKEVMKFFPDVLTLSESNILANKIETSLHNNGWGLWAIELIENNCFIGFVGLHSPNDTFPFAPCVEIGWRLSRKYWGHGYATEAATEALNFGFNVLNLDEIVSFTTVTNTKSRALMQKLHMINTNQNFMHPSIDSSNPLCEHVLYKIHKAQWLNK